MIIESGSGKRLAEFRDLPGLPTSQTVPRDDLYRAMYRKAVDRGIRIEQGKRLVQAEVLEDRVIAQFEDGSEAEGDALIGADGIGSTVRTLIDPAAPGPEYGGMCGFGSWLPESDVEPTDGAYHMIFGKQGCFGYIVAEDRRTLVVRQRPERAQAVDCGGQRSSSYGVARAAQQDVRGRQLTGSADPGPGRAS
jgi:FAD-dependent urate hydroxylase